MTDATLTQRLRDTTKEMACSAAVPMDLWNRHSNAFLEAASTITSLQEGYPTFRVGNHQNAFALRSRSKVDRLIP